MSVGLPVTQWLPCAVTDPREQLRHATLTPPPPRVGRMEERPMHEPLPHAIPTLTLWILLAVWLVAVLAATLVAVLTRDSDLLHQLFYALTDAAKMAFGVGVGVVLSRLLGS